MSSTQFRSFYSQEELEKLYPKTLELELVQVLLRHGERTPVTARFQNAGLPAYWPYCSAARRMRSVIHSPGNVTDWDSLEWRRRFERLGDDDGPVVACGPESEVEGICQMGELTDKGRETTHELGKRLRHLYVNQLKFMPSLIDNADLFYLRSTPVPRALESIQQTFWGMYPPDSRAASFPPPTILTRSPSEETLFPNESHCRRFGQLARAFAQRAADRWNETEDMDYLTKKLTKWMPENSKKVAVDSHPRLSGIMDTLNATLAHGSQTRLPSEFYDARVRQIIERVATEEWFAGYVDSREYRRLGIGGLSGDVVGRMMSKVNQSEIVPNETNGKSTTSENIQCHDESIKFALSGCHDTTMAAFVASLGAFEYGKWPPFTSHIAIEMFKTKISDHPIVQTQPNSEPAKPVSKPGWLASMLGFGSSLTAKATVLTESINTDRKPFSTLSPDQKSRLEGHYVRVRYNDTPITIPACREAGNHYEGDESLCTLEAFKRVVDGFTPKSWKSECAADPKTEIVGIKQLKDVKQPAGYIEEGC